MFICLRPPPLLVLGFCLEWSSNFIGSESGQTQSVRLLQNMVSNRTLVLFNPVQSYSVLFVYPCTALFNQVQSCLTLFSPLQTCSVLYNLFGLVFLFNPVKSYSTLFSLVQSCSVLFYPVYSYSVVFNYVHSSSTLSGPVQL